MLLADPTSFHARRAEFADHAIWLTKYADGELYSGGTFTNQSRGGTGIKSFVSRTESENVRNEDIVVWHSFSLTHIPRIEDFPVMPCEIITVGLKPSNFFEGNPALDVPASEQRFNKSSLYEAESHMQGSQERTVGEVGGHCDC
jgi:primary-amine oxidase